MDRLRLQGVTKVFGGLTAINDLSFDVPAGQITGLIGPNGAGKTTVINMITGIAVATRGEVKLNDMDLTRAKCEQVARQGIARTFQNIRLLKEESALHNVVIGCHRHEKSSWIANMLGLPQVWRERREFVRRAFDLLDQFGMTAFADTPAGSLSYGHQRRIEIMRALAMSPRFLLLDEPVAGMNHVEAAELGRMLRALADRGLGILLVEHNVAFVTDICNQVCVVDAGRKIAEGTAEAVCRDPLVIAAYLGS
jgi:branched-chain amino acid transport system ATP-binding protein